MSLPLALETRLGSIPGRPPYVASPPETSRLWRERLPSGVKVGLAWAGNSRHYNDTRRSMPAAALRPLQQVGGVAFVSLQQGATHDATPPFDCLPVGPGLADFAETAAVISNLDLVITVDTAVAHLAGALSKPVWILLPFAAEYRWLLDREDSPWYPSARLFRQTVPGDWVTPIAQVVAALQCLTTAAADAAGRGTNQLTAL